MYTTYLIHPIGKITKTKNRDINLNTALGYGEYIYIQYIDKIYYPEWLLQALKKGHRFNVVVDEEGIYNYTQKNMLFPTMVGPVLIYKEDFEHFDIDEFIPKIF